MSPRRSAVTIAVSLAIAGLACSQERAPSSPTPPTTQSAVTPDQPGASNPPPQTPQTPPPGGGQTVTMIGVGDIGECGAAAVAQTARLVEGIPGILVLAGDIAYPHGSTDDFRRCFDPWWGKFRDRWRPSPGNHEYETPGAQGYFDYFGAVAGPAGRGYYSFRAGEWLVLMLNSNERFVSTRAGSAQYEFVRSELLNNTARCTMAVWHHPIFSSGPNGPNNYLRDLWGLLDRQDVELVVNGHDHLYERFAKQDIDMRRDDKGIRQITAGGGGAHLYRFPRIEPNSEVRITNNGVLKLTLTPTGYEWQFIEVSGAVTDAGSDVCF